MAARQLAALLVFSCISAAETAVSPIWPQLQGTFPMRIPLAKKAFNIAVEPYAVSDKYGRTAMGQGSLLARKLVEAGVRFVSVGKGDNAWDHHGTPFPSYANEFMPELDQAFSGLLVDLDHRGMLDTTLVLVTGELGRTAKMDVNNGRDHWPNCFSLLLAGPGVLKGQVIGEPESEGMFVTDRPVEVPDLMATMVQKCGVPFENSHMANIGGPIKIAEGNPLKFLA